MNWRAIIFGLALFLMGCGERNKPESCEIRVETWYEWNRVTNLLMGPFTEPRCILPSPPQPPAPDG